MRLGTTTWPFRGTEHIGAIMQQAVADHVARPVIVDIGPGGMSGIGRYFHPIGKSEAWTARERLCRGIGRFTDNIARTFPFLGVTSPEMEAVFLASLALNPGQLVFIDDKHVN